MTVLAVLLLAAPDAATHDLMRQSRFDDVQQVLVAKRQRGDWDVDDQLMLAAACLATGDLDCASLLYSELLEPPPRTALAHFGLGEVARLRGDQDKAFAAYRAYLNSTAPGRSDAYDQLATARLAALVGGPVAGAPSSRPTYSQLSFVASRWAAISFLPAVAAGTITGLVMSQDRVGDLSLLFAAGAGMAVFGGGVSFGMTRYAAARGYQGNGFGAAVVAGLGPGVALVGTAAAVEYMGFADSETIALLGTLGAATTVVVAAPVVFARGLRPMGAEERSGQVPSVLSP